MNIKPLVKVQSQCREKDIDNNISENEIYKGFCNIAEKAVYSAEDIASFAVFSVIGMREIFVTACRAFCKSVFLFAAGRASSDLLFLGEEACRFGG